VNPANISAIIIAAGSLVTAIASLISAIKTKGTTKDNTQKLAVHSDEISNIQSDVGEVKEALNGAVSGDGKHASKTEEGALQEVSTQVGRLSGWPVRFNRKS
jgi:hypothetical protein